MTAQNVGWSAIQKDLIPTTVQLSKETAARAYSPLKQAFTLSYECFGAMIEQFFIDLQATAQRKGINDSQTDIAFSLETTVRNFQSYAEEIIGGRKGPVEEGKDQKGSGAEKSANKDGKLRLGLTFEEQIACIRKVQGIAVQWFESQSVIINSKKYWLATSDKIAVKTWHHNPEMLRFLFKQFKLRGSKEPTSFTAADLKAFGIQEKDKISDPTKLNCALFALMKVRELRAKDYIFHGKELPMEDLQKILTSWGYAPVDTPRPDDLVMYLDASGTATHLGRYLSTGQVESKLGTRMTHFHWHNIFDVPDHYGNRIVFLRKV